MSSAPIMRQVPKSHSFHFPFSHRTFSGYSEWVGEGLTFRSR